EGEAVTRISSFPVRIRFPSRRTLSRSCALVSRCARGKRARADSSSDAAVSAPRDVLARDANRQTLATLLATAAEYLTPPLRGHALAESVRTDAALVTGAIGWLAHMCSRPGSKMLFC